MPRLPSPSPLRGHRYAATTPRNSATAASPSTFHVSDRKLRRSGCVATSGSSLTRPPQCVAAIAHGQASAIPWPRKSEPVTVSTTNATITNVNSAWTASSREARNSRRDGEVQGRETSAGDQHRH